MPALLESRPLSEFVGCEILNFDARGQAGPDSIDAICALLWKHHVVVLRDQSFTPQELLDFTALFGEIDGTHVQSDFTLPGYPDIYVISNLEKEGKALGTKTVGHHWHTDWAYKAIPAAYTMLYGVEVPEGPHRTLFASQRRVYELLSEEQKADFRQRQARYHFAKSHNAKPFYAPLSPEQLAKTPPVEHPMLRIHPGTGKEGLFVNRADCVGVSGMSDEEGVTLVNRLVEEIVNPDFIYAHEWKPRDVVIWDNRSILHAATPYDMENHRRLIYRTTVKGERPIPPV